MRSIEARGGKVIIVDPRRSETASKVGEHLFIQPGTDAFLLLAMLAVLHFELDFSTSERDEFADGARETTRRSKAMDARASSTDHRHCTRKYPQNC